ncbi:hypothetical protein BDC45DRAFT_576431 [Circinella umbellata]|nr:hypothetical protein BDC45DRAFT_576431 [Circinella umbellata]
MTKEQTTNIPVAFSDMSEELLPYIRFYFNLGSSLETTIDAIKNLEQDNLNNIQEIQNVNTTYTPSFPSKVDPLVI